MNVRGGEPPLHVGGAGQRRKADHVADGIDVRHGGLEVLVDVELAALIRLNADFFQPHVVGVAGAAVGPQQDVGLQLLAALADAARRRRRGGSTCSYCSSWRINTPRSRMW